MVEHVDFDVQVQMGLGSPALSIVDLPDRAVAGSRERVSTTLDSIGRSNYGLVGKVFGESMEISDISRYGTFVDTEGIVSARCSLQPDNELHRVGGSALLDSLGL